jgi:NTP pyrophosphatase (non-canonical NTP hydrolase)
MPELTFRHFQALNWNRAMRAKKFKDCESWSLNDWAVALTGEVGELCNLLKKVRRKDFPLEKVKKKICKEAADVMIYTDIFMSAIGTSTEKEVVNKWNEVSRRIKYGIQLDKVRDKSPSPAVIQTKGPRRRDPARKSRKKVVQAVRNRRS